MAKSKHKSRATLFIALLCAGVLIGVGVLLMRSTGETITVSAVHREIQTIAEHGGDLGPWRISASRIERTTGEFHDFTLYTTNLRLGAKTAKLVIDPEDDTIAFEMQRVVFTVPPKDYDSPENELIELEMYTLGPVPFRRDIVSDGTNTNHIEPQQLPSLVNAIESNHPDDE